MITELYIPQENLFFIEKTKRPNVTFISDTHYHNTYEIYFLLSGTRRQLVDHSIHDIKRGDLILIPKGVIHKTTPLDKNSHARYVVNFSEEFAASLEACLGQGVLAQTFAHVKLSVPEYRFDYVLSLFDKMNDEYSAAASDNFSATLIRGYMAELFAFICRTRRSLADSFEGASSVAILEPNIQQAAQYISEHFREDIALADVAARAYMSESYFSRKFKKITGLNFSEYLTSTRIKAADDLLLRTDMSMAEIAAACGFGDANYFGDIFKKHKGMSPTKYRRMHAKC
ncbi:MAG: helix-turn-helix transcriptional regulator [Firmicutes bacterium]|nr:helix-turn-helix transcriptional regulator [Bacillota bacterium]